MSDTPLPQTPVNDRLRRWLGPALLISLVINLFLVGMIAAAVIAHRPGKYPDFRSPPPPFFRMMKRGAADLPPGDRAAMRDIMVRQFPIIRPYFARIDAARRDLADMIAANPYDAIKVGAAFAKVDAAQAEMVKAAREAMIQGFGKMSNEQRVRLADAMRKQADRRLNGRDDGPARQAPLPLPPGKRAPAGPEDGPPPSDSGAGLPPMVSDALGLGAPPPPPGRAPGGSAPSSELGFTGAPPPPSGMTPFNGRPPQ